VWSPETLLCAAVADCLILTFRGISRAARLEWSTLECRVEGLLDRVDGVSQFTSYTVFADLVIPEGVDAARAKTLLERAEHACLISNSLRGSRTLEARVSTRREPEEALAASADYGLPEGL
jgi:organic hydroperoxide reductase OsmC/OhrA